MATFFNIISSAQVPASITDVVAVAGNGQVTLTWTAPDNRGSAITDYLVDYQTTPSGGWTLFADGTSASTGATVTGLTNTTEYEFRVAAVNAVGTGAESSTSNAVTPTAGASPLTWRGTPQFSTTGTTAVPAGTTAGDTLIGVVSMDDYYNRTTPFVTPTLPTGETNYSLVHDMATPGWTEYCNGIYVWTADFTSGATIAQSVSAGTFECALYAVNGTVTGVTVGTYNAAQSATAPTWGTISSDADDLAIAICGTYNPASTYTKADGAWTQDRVQVAWAGLNAMSKSVSGSETTNVSPAGSHATDKSSSIIIRVAG